MTVKEIISRIREECYDKGVPSDDTRLRARLVFNKMLTVRNTLLAQKANKNQLLASSNYNTITEKLVLVPSPINGITSKLYRTANQIPNIVYKLDSPLVLTVQNRDVNNPFYITMTTYDKARYAKSSQYTANNKKYFIHNSYIYFIGIDCDLREVDITAIWENVLFNKNSCKPYQDYEFPLQGELVESMIQMCQETLIKIFYPIIHDTLNNTVDDRQK
jgi:hypothetical protein